MKTALVILAAGIGSRFGGGVKQLEPVGPNGEIIMDYSVNDAIEAGFNKIVFIIRKDIEKDFKEIIGDRIARKIEVAYAYQSLDKLPEGFRVPEGRTKPWGTSQALLCARDVINEPFAVINADDYYGKGGFKTINEWLRSNRPKTGDGRHNISLVGFILKNTLSDNGGVTRGICVTDENGNLTGINETKNIVKTEDGAGIKTPDGIVGINDESPVSMNMWGLYPEFLGELEHMFPDFLNSLGDEEKTKEFLLPVTIDRLLKNNAAAISLLASSDKWFGVTYKEDKETVKKAFSDLIERGIYRTPL
ncbi:MAG: sugar phosphate nucleotidyltransferase [Lachnospiraceae bacterium]|jgi:hypothetical protein